MVMAEWNKVMKTIIIVFEQDTIMDISNHFIISYIMYMMTVVYNSHFIRKYRNDEQV